MRQILYFLNIILKAETKNKCLKHLFFLLSLYWSVRIAFTPSSWFDSKTWDFAYWEIPGNIPGFNWLYLPVQCSMQALSCKDDVCQKTSWYSSLRLMLIHCTQLSYCNLNVYSILMSRKSMNMWTDPYSSEEHKAAYASDMSHSEK